MDSEDKIWNDRGLRGLGCQNTECRDIFLSSFFWANILFRVVVLKIYLLAGSSLGFCMCAFPNSKTETLNFAD